jgi:hypothetical protein
MYVTKITLNVPPPPPPGNISMISVEWWTYFLASTFAIPLSILVYEVVHLANSPCNYLYMVFVKSIGFI